LNQVEIAHAVGPMQLNLEIVEVFIVFVVPGLVSVSTYGDPIADTKGVLLRKDEQIDDQMVGLVVAGPPKEQSGEQRHEWHAKNEEDIEVAIGELERMGGGGFVCRRCAPRPGRSIQNSRWPTCGRSISGSPSRCRRGARRWWGALRQILPTARVEQNVVHYSALFDVLNDDGALLPGMTTQVFFVTSAARGRRKAAARGGMVHAICAWRWTESAVATSASADRPPTPRLPPATWGCGLACSNSSRCGR
jgi:hypothetical protein